ncbi:MAG: hypothetical protein MHM6MM_002634 [Cercozoa sp. M6MM]
MLPLCSGMLSIGAVCLGAAHVIGFDMDPEALQIAVENFASMELGADFSPVLCDVTRVRPLLQSHDDSDSELHTMEGVFDTVIMNPPFGTRTARADFHFLQVAFRLLRPGGSIYSMHKTSTRDFLAKKGREFGATVQLVAKLKFDVPKMYRFHKEKTKNIEVDLLRFHVPAVSKEPTENS